MTVQGHPFHEGDITSIDFSSDSSTILTGSADATVKLTNISGAKPHVLGTLQGEQNRAMQGGEGRCSA